MPTHDCSKCPLENCPIRDIALWLNEHDSEVEVATKEESYKLAQSYALVVQGIPIPIYDRDTILTAIRYTFYLGYHKGWTYQDVPAVFKEE